MELQTVRQIIDTLAQGVHPVTGEAMPDDSPYHAPPVIRALHAASRAIEQAQASAGPGRPVRLRAAAPPKAGERWTPEDDAALRLAHAEGTALKQIAQLLGRTPFGVEQRLIKLGCMPAPPGGGRFGGADARTAPAGGVASSAAGGEASGAVGGA